MEPKNLKLWTRPENYMGEVWPNYYSAGVGQSRDSDALGRSNFRCMWNAVSQASTCEETQIVSEKHWAVGWVEWIAIHQDDTAALAVADAIKGKLGNYPVVCEDDFSALETEDADETWRNCYSPSERIQWIRAHRSQFEFRSFSDLLGCVRGNYFAGYASDLL